MSRRGSLLIQGILGALCAVLLLAAAPAGAETDRCTKDVCIDRKAFYEGLRRFNRRHPLAQNPKKLRPRSFDAMQDILDHWDTSAELTDTRWLAYIISTVFWETGGYLYPVREGLCDDAPCAIAHLERLWRKRMVRQRYWDPDPETGRSYYGRGQVQLTHLVNYWRVGGELTRTQSTEQFVDLEDKLVAEPDLALTDWVSTAALIEGMVRGWYNIEIGKGLGSYINRDAPNDRVAYLEARRTVNGLDKRDLLADFAIEIHRFVKAIPASTASDVDRDSATTDIEDGKAVDMEESDGKVRGKRRVDKSRKVGPERDREPEVGGPRKGVDLENPIGPIRNLSGVVGGAAGAAARGTLRTPPTKKELRKKRKKRRKRQRRRRKRQRQRERNQKKE
ncbi:MAG: hypothetical protein AAF211_14340 [Myxococcota bacterium]